MKKILLGAVCALSLTACVTMTPEEISAMNAAANRPVTCDNQEDCAIKWGRALKWTLSNSAYRIQQSTDMLIQTAGPSKDSPSPAYVVTRVPMGNGRETFELQGGCDNLFGCIPSITASRASFANAVMND